MKISELIKELEHQKETYGDLKVLLASDKTGEVVKTEQIFFETDINGTDDTLSLMDFPY